MPLLESMRITGSAAIDCVHAITQKFAKQFTTGISNKNRKMLTQSLKASLIYTDPSLEEKLPLEFHSLMTRYTTFLQHCLIIDATHNTSRTYLTNYPNLPNTNNLNVAEETHQWKYKMG